MSLHKRVRRLNALLEPAQISGALDNPVFLVSAPRSGSTLLFAMLAHNPDVCTIGGESHGLYREFPHLTAADAAFSSGALSAAHADDATASALRTLYAASLRNGVGEALYDRLVRDGEGERGGAFLEKTPRNALNIPFLLAVFPKARFIFLHREPRANISSIIEGWQHGAKTGQFVTYRDLPGRPGPWCFLLPLGWGAVADRSLAEIAAFQWRAANDAIMTHLSALPRERWVALDYEAVVDHPAETLERLSAFLGVAVSPAQKALGAGWLPLSASTITPPDKAKWHRHAVELAAVENVYSATYERIKTLNL